MTAVFMRVVIVDRDVCVLKNFNIFRVNMRARERNKKTLFLNRIYALVYRRAKVGYKGQGTGALAIFLRLYN